MTREDIRTFCLLMAIITLLTTIFFKEQEIHDLKEQIECQKSMLNYYTTEKQSQSKNVKIGCASFYSVKSNGGKTTASGIALNDYDYTCASLAFPLHSKLRITNLQNNKSVVVKVTDTGPFAINSNGQTIRPLRAHPTRIIDLNLASAKAIYTNLKSGTIKVKVEQIK